MPAGDFFILLFVVICPVPLVPLIRFAVLAPIHALDVWEHNMGTQHGTKTRIRNNSNQAHRVVPGWHGRKMFREDVTRLALGVTIVQNKQTFLKQIVQPRDVNPVKPLNMPKFGIFARHNDTRSCLVVLVQRHLRGAAEDFRPQI